MSLTTEQMNEVSGVFQESLAYVLSNLPSKEAQASLKGFLAQLVMQEKPYLLVTQEGLSRVIDLVWTSPGYSDFIMSLSFVFFSRWGHGEEEVSGLCANLARGCAMINRSEKQLDAVPQLLGDRLSDIDAARRLIQANHWLVIVLLVQLFVTVAPQPIDRK